MKLTWRPSALAQLDAICGYIAQDNPAAAAALQVRVEQVAGYLAEYPYMGRATQGRPSVRSKLVAGYPYRIFYTILPDRDEVRIIRVRDVRRRPLDRP